MGPFGNLPKFDSSSTVYGAMKNEANDSMVAATRFAHRSTMARGHARRFANAARPP